MQVRSPNRAPKNVQQRGELIFKMDFWFWFELVAIIIMSVFSWWMYFSWVNSRYNDEDKDVTDAFSPEEYTIRKNMRFFMGK